MDKVFIFTNTIFTLSKPPVLKMEIITLLLTWKYSQIFQYFRIRITQNEGIFF
jgi:hypothetical protein